jgi:predicted RNA-binding Zn-ribbon protein involved in translation (DUF1610 family)
MYEEWVSWESLSKIEVPKIRVYTKKSPEKEESIRNAIRKSPEVFFHRSPLVVTRSAESGRLFLGDGADRLKIAIEEKVPKVMLSIEEYETDSEAYEAAQDDSYRMNEDRGDVVTYSVVELIRERYQKGMTVKEIAEKYDKSESHIRNILAVAKDEELMKLLKEEKITLYDAIRAAHDPELKREILNKAIIISAELKEVEKPRIAEVSAREARTEEIEVCQKSSEEILKKEPGFEEIYERAVRKAEAELGRKIGGTIKHSVKRIAEALNMRDEDDIEILLRKAEEILGGEKSDIQQKVLWAWKREAEKEEIGREWGWGPLTIKEALSRILREVKKEEYAETKPIVSTYRPVSETRPKVEKPAQTRVRAGVEEAPKPSVEYMEAKRGLLVRRREESRTVLRELLIREFPWAGDPSILVDEFWGIYDEAGPIGTFITLRLAMPELMKILKPSRALPRAIGWLSIVEGELFYKKRSEVIDTINQTYEENRDAILEAVAKHKEEEAHILLNVFKSVEPRVVESAGGDKIYLYFIPEEPRVALAMDKGVYVTLKDAKREKAAKAEVERRVRVQEALAERSFLGVNGWINKGAVVKTEEVRVLESPEGLGVFECPRCGEVARDLYTLLPFMCHKCLWPIPLDSLPYALRDSWKEGEA